MPHQHVGLRKSALVAIVLLSLALYAILIGNISDITMPELEDVSY